MSRIHEALDRAAGGNPTPSASRGDQTAFRSAWPVSGSERPAPMGERPAPVSERRDDPAPLLGASQPATYVTGFAHQWRERLVNSADGNSAFTEQFRRLAATLHHAQIASGIRLIMVTSAVPDDGKTLTSLNLALVLSDSYARRVLLIDADLRHPSIPDVVDLRSSTGLSETLQAARDQKLPLVQLTPTLTLLPAGQPVPDPIGGLTSLRMRRILEEASERFDWVILDATPVGTLADASLLAEMVHGTLFVIRAGQTQYASVKKAIEVLGRERILGVVLNGARQVPSSSHEDYFTGEPSPSIGEAPGR